jgi:hypothetical protein
MLMPVTSFELRQRKLDFRSSGQSLFDATALIANDVELVNAIERLDFSGEVVQLIVCEQCGYAHCAPGSYVNFRKLGEQVVLVPALSAMREGEFELREYAPPAYMWTQGLPIFSADVYDELRREIGTFPVRSSIHPCTSLDALDMLQFTAPGGVLGKPGSAAVLQSEWIVAVTEGDLSQEIETFSELIRAVQKGEENLHSMRPERLVEFHLDILNFPSWRPFGYDARGPVLNLGEIIL